MTVAPSVGWIEMSPRFSVPATSSRFGGPGSFLMSLDRSALPVLGGSFHRAFVETMLGNGTADARPNEVELDAPTDAPDVMTALPG